MSTCERIDFHKVLEDCAYLGLTGTALALRIGIKPGALKALSRGREPQPPVAEALAGLWCDLMTKKPQFLPRTSAPPGQARPEIAGLESDVPRRSYAEMEAIAMAKL